MERGSLLQIFFIIVLVLGLYITIPIGTLFMDKVADSFTASGLTDVAGNVTSARAQVTEVTNTGFVFIFIGAGIAMLVGSAMVFSSPAMFILGLIVMIMGVLASFLASNMAQTIGASATVTAEYAQYPLMLQIMENLPYFGIGLMILMIIIFTAKQRGGGEQYV